MTARCCCTIRDCFLSRRFEGGQERTWRQAPPPPNNVAAETFIDNVERLAFDNWAEHEALSPEGAPIQEMAYPRAKAERQIPMHIRAALDERAKNICVAEIIAVA